MLLRRIERDIKERGRTFESVRDQYLATVKPMYLKFAEPSKRYADIIIPNYGFSMDTMDINDIMIPIPAVELIIKQVEQQGKNKFYL